MSKAEQKLNERAQRLAQQGADPLRLEALERAGEFKRSWVSMADVLVRVRQSRAYEPWGYADLYAYCAEELLIKRATVDKLTASYIVVERYAPEMLGADGVDQQLPSVDAVDYFARAVGERGPKLAATSGTPDVVDELRRAVFDELQPASALRRDFHPVLYAKSEEQQLLDALQKTRAEVRKLVSMLDGLPGISTQRIDQVMSALEALELELDDVIPAAREQVPAQAAVASSGSSA